MRKCSRCGSEGPFHKNSNSPDGLHSVCAACVKARKKEYNSRPDVAEKRRLRWLEWSRTEEGKRVRAECRKRYRTNDRNKLHEVEYSRRYMNTEEFIRKKREREKRYRHSEAYKTAQRKRRSRNKEEGKARAAVVKALEDGILVRPDTCSTPSAFCDGPICGHHEDYSNPLCVIWLCRFHHLELHRIKDRKNWRRFPPAHSASQARTCTDQE